MIKLAMKQIRDVSMTDFPDIHLALEIMKELPVHRKPIKAVLFDFDGTISTLRQGWEEIMEPLMVEMITGPLHPTEELIQEVERYIDESTGIQTIFQMQWLEEKVREYGLNPQVYDKWWYKDEYNRRLLNMVEKRVQSLERGEKSPKDFMILGVEDFVKRLHSKGIDLYVASGTDHPDVVREVASLGLSSYFTRVAGAPERRVDCSKEAVLRSLIEERGLAGEELVVIGDGKVEIALGVEAGGITVGAATDEIRKHGVNPAKRVRLIGAGAHVIVGDFRNQDQLLSYLGV